MDLKEILKEAGLDDKAIKQVLTTMKAEKIYTTSEENADIRLKKNKEKIEKLEGELDDAVTKIEGFKDLENEKETFIIITRKFIVGYFNRNVWLKRLRLKKTSILL